MGLITKEVEVGINGKNQKWYRDLGYQIPLNQSGTIHFGGKIRVKTEDLTKGSNAIVEVECDNCFAKLSMAFYNYNNHKKEDKYYCNKCAVKLYGTKNMLKAKLDNSISFLAWCLKNNREDILNLWDYELNSILPSEITYSTKSSYYFKCPRNLHKSELKTISLFTRGQEGSMRCNKCNWFAQFNITNLGEDFLLKYWDYSKNIYIDPWIISKKSLQKIWIKCLNNNMHGSYPAKAYSFSNGIRCPYCSGAKTHPEDSFAKFHIEHTDLDFVNKYWGNKNTINPYEISPHSNKMIWINCQINLLHGEYKIQANSFTNGRRCGYCSSQKVHVSDSLGTLFPNVFSIWSDKNIKSPYDYLPESNSFVLWKCENSLHKEYKRKIQASKKSEFRCPECVRNRDESFLQEKVRTYITEKYKYKLNHEYNCSIIPINPKTNCKLPFDNEIIELKLIVEVNGEAHYKTHTYSSIWRDIRYTPEQQLKDRQIKDRYKRIIAHLSGYHYLEIPYWTEQDESYKQLIDEKINSILKG